MEMQSFLNAMDWVQVTSRARGVVLLLVIAMSPFIGHYAWFLGEYMVNSAMCELTTGERLPLSISAPEHWLFQKASITLAGLAGFVWVLGEILNYAQRAADSEKGE